MLRLCDGPTWINTNGFPSISIGNRHTYSVQYPLFSCLMTDLDRMAFNGRNHNGEINADKNKNGNNNDENCPGDEELWEQLETL